MRRATLVLLSGFIALGACGNSDNDSAAEPDAATTTSTSAAVVTTTEAPPTASTVAETSKCETVGFTPNSEDAASDITATGLSCAEARTFVGVAGRQTSSGGPDRVDVEGYNCVRTRTEDDPLPRSFYTCTSGAKKVTFVRS